MAGLARISRTPLNKGGKNSHSQENSAGKDGDEEEWQTDSHDHRT